MFYPQNHKQFYVKFNGRGPTREERETGPKSLRPAREGPETKGRLVHKGGTRGRRSIGNERLNVEEKIPGGEYPDGRIYTFILVYV